MLNKLKQLKQMRDQALAIKRELANERVTLEKNGVKIVMSGDQRVESLEIDGQEDRRLLDLINQAIKKSQEVAAKKLSQMSGGLSGLLP
jgi:DNA-binding protein YbaB